MTIKGATSDNWNSDKLEPNSFYRHFTCDILNSRFLTPEFIFPSEIRGIGSPVFRITIQVLKKNSICHSRQGRVKETEGVILLELKESWNNYVLELAFCL